MAKKTAKNGEKGHNPEKGAGPQARPTAPPDTDARNPRKRRCAAAIHEALAECVLWPDPRHPPLPTPPAGQLKPR